jgi:hypothetical protein
MRELSILYSKSIIVISEFLVVVEVLNDSHQFFLELRVVASFIRIHTTHLQKLDELFIFCINIVWVKDRVSINHRSDMFREFIYCGLVVIRYHSFDLLVWFLHRALKFRNTLIEWGSEARVIKQEANVVTFHYLDRWKDISLFGFEYKIEGKFVFY